VLCDLRMPFKSGVDILNEMQESVQLNHIPVIILSAVGEEGRRIAKDAGAVEYFSKPYNVTELLFRISLFFAHQGHYG